MPAGTAGNPIRVVIVGGGCAGMAAAWELAKQPGYEIHVYEKTPRLGGKGSSTRDDKDRILEHGLHVWMGWYENAFRMMRQCYGHVEERLAEENKGLSKAQAKRKWRQLAHSRFKDAFTPEPNVGLVEPAFHGRKMLWTVLFPPNEGEPGKPMTAQDNPFTIAAYTTRSMALVRGLILSVVDDIPGKTPGPPRPDERSRSDEILSLDMQTPAADSTAALLTRMAEISRASALTGAAALLQLVTMLEVWLRRQNIGPKAPESTLAIAEAAVSQVRKLLRDLVGVDPVLRMKTEVIDIILTVMIGLFNDRVMFREDGLDALNDYDYREWLTKHGATKTATNSPFIRAAYDFAFAYVDGNLDKPRLAAGVAIRGGFRMFFTYRGAAFWRMNSGMGDAIFAPLYAVLDDWREQHKDTLVAEEAERARDGQVARASGKDVESDAPPPLLSPVHFHFAHELKAAHFDHKGLSLAKLEFKTGDDHDPPLRKGGWPDQDLPPPDDDGPTLTRRENPDQPLTPRDNLFDFAIIATGVHEFGDIFVRPFNKKTHEEDGGPDRATLKAWRRTTELTKTTATKSAQVWLPTDIYDLGWRRGSGLFTCMQARTYDTYADMTHILAAENAAAPWRSLAYFCNPLQDIDRADIEKLKAALREKFETEVPKADVEARVAAVLAETIHLRHKQTAKDDLTRLITTQMDDYWPNLFPEELRPEASTDEGPGRTVEDLRRQRTDKWEAWVKGATEAYAYTRPNHRGSERYTLSLPGSISARISPLDEWVDNMTVAGDWTACGLDCGCVEAAVVSGMLAAAAISGTPEISDIVGYDQP